MMDNEYFITIWKYVFIFCFAMTCLLITSCQTTNYQIRKAIEAGVSPLEANCALADCMEAERAIIARQAD